MSLVEHAQRKTLPFSPSSNGVFGLQRPLLSPRAPAASVFIRREHGPVRLMETGVIFHMLAYTFTGS